MQINRLRAAIIISFLIFIFSSFILISGCGYTTSGANIPSGINTIYVATFSNKVDITREISKRKIYQVYHPLLEVDITKSVIDRFLLDGNLRIAPEDKADWILKGELVEFRRDPLRYAGDEETVEEYRINIIVNLTLLDKKGDVVWKEDTFIGDTTYFTQGASAKSESTAIDDAITDLSKRIVERVVEDW